MLDMAKDRRICKKCNEAKDILEFPLYNKERGWRRHECEECYRHRHKDMYNANRGHRLKQARERYSYDPAVGWTSKRKQQAYSAANRRREKYRDIVVSMYGGECAACGETEPLFLTMDHINNDGWQLRKSNYREGGIALYLDVMRHGKRDDLEVLCYNCNFGKNRNGGVLVRDRRVNVRCNDHPERE